MKRRHFMRAATACVLLPAAEASGIALIARASEPDYVFFDERFETAKRIVASWSGARAIAVRSDITAVWTSGLDRMICDGVLQLRGVTTQAFLFCLRVLAEERAFVDAQAARIDRDLFAWTVHTLPRKPTAERCHG